MKKQMIGAVVVAAILALSLPVWAYTITEVGGEDTLFGALNISNSGNELQALGWAEVPDSSGSSTPGDPTLWQLVTGGTNANVWAFNLGVFGVPGDFLIKTGNNTYATILTPDGPYNAFIFHNNLNNQFAVIDLDDFYKLNGNCLTPKAIQISRVSHVDVKAVPEPTTILLLGSGLIGIGLLRRRKIK